MGDGDQVGKNRRWAKLWACWPAAAQCKEVPHLVERRSAGQAGVGVALVYVGQRWSLLAEPAKDADGCGDVAVGMTLLAA